MTNGTPAPAHPGFGPSAISRQIDVLGSSMHWVESGEGDPIVFLHGNPTSSFLWRKVFARCAGRGRLLAPDLIGFGQSGKPEIGYTLADHEQYLDAWFDALNLRRVTLVLQDYGGLFGVSWARRHADRVKAIALMEPVLHPVASKELPDAFVQMRNTVLQPGTGEQFVLEDNHFLEAVSRFFIAPLPEEDRLEYLKPFPTPASRRPVIVFPRHLPVDGQPQVTVDLLARNAEWLRVSAVPKLLLTFEPGFLITPAVIDWARANVRALEVEAAGAGLHFVQEEQPEAIGAALGAWMDRHQLGRTA